MDRKVEKALEKVLDSILNVLIVIACEVLKNQKNGEEKEKK